ncbi:MAG: enoyl-CoA hydratase/isomerase family protein [Rhodobacteraceae bacterium]|nr:enoyl-CoA hydratase/isomerase family protein [Paracoccaceae bacterium]
MAAPALFDADRWTDIALRRDGPVAWVTLNRPAKANAVRPQMQDELAQALEGLDRDREVRVVILEAAGERVFSAGFDMSEQHRPESSRDWDDLTRASAGVCMKIWDMDKPVICTVQGHAIAFGCLLALICDLTIATEEAWFSEPEIRHGTLTPMIIMPWLTHMKAVHEFYYTGDAMPARRALELGLINRVVPAAELAPTAERMARRIANAPAYTLLMAKRALRQAYEIMGFRGIQGAHRYLDTYLLDSHGDPRKEELKRIRREDGLRAFLEARDGPYRDG